MDDRHIQAEGPAALAERLERALQAERDAAERDPFANPVLLFAGHLGRLFDRHQLGLDEMEALAAELTARSFAARAKRLTAYLGGADLEADRAAIAGVCVRLAGEGGFDAYQKAVGAARFGVVFTAHPTFSLRMELAQALAELATGRDGEGVPLSAEGRDERMALARRLRHEPPHPLTLDIEHDWSVKALANAHDALQGAYHTAFAVARARWPKRWRELKPRLVSLASWVGYDTDGRTDITWMDTIDKRLTVKRLSLERHRAAVWKLSEGAEGAWGEALGAVGRALETAWQTVSGQLALLAEAQADAGRTAAFSRAMVEGRGPSLADTRPLIAMIDAAAAVAPDDAAAERLLVLKAVIGCHGLSLAHVHVRLNASQLHNAIRRQIGLDTPPNDPANRRSYFGTVGELIGRVRPVSVNFKSVMAEQASAKRLMITVAQMLKFIDGAAPVRFLIAETESGFTLLTALYYARLFGVDEQIDISPLFETEEGFERGEAVIEEALRSPDYVAYLRKRGRLAVQLGYSDSGRFIGQMAATFRIERLKLRLAELMARHGLQGLEVVLFDTHGESIGRGGHPLSLADRLRYVAPPRSHAEFAERGVRTKQEVSWQGGDGYLPFFTGPAATASLARILEFSFGGDDEGAADPIYAAPDFASEFFATIQQEFTALAADPDYAALLGLYGPESLGKDGLAPRRAAERGQDAQGRDHPRGRAARHPQQLDPAADGLSRRRGARGGPGGGQGRGHLRHHERPLAALSPGDADGARGPGLQRHRRAARLSRRRRPGDVAGARRAGPEPPALGRPAPAQRPGRADRPARPAGADRPPAAARPPVPDRRAGARGRRGRHAARDAACAEGRGDPAHRPARRAHARLRAPARRHPPRAAGAADAAGGAGGGRAAVADLPPARGGRRRGRRFRRAGHLQARAVTDLRL